MRTSGILMPVSSLPSPHGIGTLGKAAYDFVDFLAEAGQSLWQTLPYGPTGYGDSPYQSFSAFAGNPYFIDLDMLADEGMLAPGEIGDDWGGDDSLVDYGLLFEKRFAVLAKAVERQNKAAPAYLAFCHEHRAWLDDYAMYMALKEAHGQVSFQEWPEALRRRDKAALQRAEAQWGPRIEFWRCLQYFFFTQWATLKTYANAQGVALVGDIPIYVSPDSSDLWANPELFQLDDNARPTAVAGVPPDAFSATGQLWGNPLYDWPYHRNTRYRWWVDRLAFSAKLFDWTRIDHFRGFASYYAVPAGDETAENGRWRAGPGKEFIRTVKRALPRMQIIAEDLGYLTEEVFSLLEYSGYPGMKVLQFAFDSREESDYLPHNYTRHCVVYTGTHDNTTTLDWTRSARPEDVDFARRYLAVSQRSGSALAEAILRAAMASVADTAIIPLPDWLELPAAGRVNTPSTLGGRNWRWRAVPGQITSALAQHIRAETRLYGRLSATEREKEALAAKREQQQAASKATRVLTRKETREAEDAAAKRGTGHEQLMENAGIRTAEVIAGLAAQDAQEDMAVKEKSVLFLCGKGNNAGDAFVAARLLAATGWKVQWLPLAGEKFSLLAALNHSRLPATVQQATPDTANWDAAVVVDAVFGTGFRGTLPKDLQDTFGLAAKAPGVRIALDIPSGLDCDTGEASPGTFPAQLTLTFGALKPGLLQAGAGSYCGEVRVLDIGL